MLGRKPWRIDILTSIDGVSFEQAWKSRVKADFVVTPLNVIGRDMFVDQEQARSRTRQRYCGRRDVGEARPRCKQAPRAWQEIRKATPSLRMRQTPAQPAESRRLPSYTYTCTLDHA
jgi:hypothetical protein